MAKKQTKRVPAKKKRKPAVRINSLLKEAILAIRSEHIGVRELSGVRQAIESARAEGVRYAQAALNKSSHLEDLVSELSAKLAAYEKRMDRMETIVAGRAAGLQRRLVELATQNGIDNGKA